MDGSSVMSDAHAVQQQPYILSPDSHPAKRARLQLSVQADTPPPSEHVPGSPTRLRPDIVPKKKYIEAWLEETCSVKRRRLSHPMEPPKEPFSTTSATHSSDSYSSHAATSISGRSQKLVETSFYRDINLAANNIFFQGRRDPLPQDIDSMLKGKVFCQRSSPGPSSEDLQDDTDLEQLELGASEDAVERYFKRHIFPEPTASDALMMSCKQPMYKHAVPEASQKFKISTPSPDILYGYQRAGAFRDPRQRSQVIDMELEPLANAEQLMYPFLAVEFKGSRANSQPLSVATNQCLGAGASCVHLAELLRQRLGGPGCRAAPAGALDSLAFSAALNGTEARLYVSWKQGETTEYHTRKVDGYLLQDPDHHRRFRRHVRNIIDWGKGERLVRIREALDCLVLSERSDGRPEQRAGSKRPRDSSRVPNKRRANSDGDET